MAFPYIYAVVAISRLDRAGATVDRPALSIVSGTKAMIVLLATTPLYALVRMQDVRPHAD